jgi:quercetin dioxygenase-like cupin family protein
MLNMDFLKEVLIDSNAHSWQASPMAGVWRKPLAREEAERGHATSIVKYEAGSFFRSHPHPGGEEIFVIQGTFSDESGDYPAGSYFRNPPGTSHAPHSKDGCELFVKLHQFKADDRVQICINTNDFLQSQQNCHLLHKHQDECVHWFNIKKATDLNELSKVLMSNLAIEILILEGDISYNNTLLIKGCWLRTHDFNLSMLTINNSAILFIKSGHF